MSSDYHTNRARSQSRAALGAPRRKLCCQPALLQKPRLGRIAVPVMPARPVLSGEPARLRELRAAEMAAWEAAFPKVRSREESTAWEPGAMSRRRLRFGVLSMFLLGACVSVAVSLDIQDFSLLRTAWSQLVGGIRNLFA